MEPKDHTKENLGFLLEEQAADLAKTGAGVTAAATPIGAAIAGIGAVHQIAKAATPETGIGDYLIASGGASKNPEASVNNAVVAALNRLSGFKSRM